jgi:hypothetical protein
MMAWRQAAAAARVVSELEPEPEPEPEQVEEASQVTSSKCITAKYLCAAYCPLDAAALKSMDGNPKIKGKMPCGTGFGGKNIQVFMRR